MGIWSKSRYNVGKMFRKNFISYKNVNREMLARNKEGGRSVEERSHPETLYQRGTIPEQTL